MLALFRTNQLLANVFLLPYVVLLHLYLFIFPEQSPQVFENGILSSWVFQWFSSIPFWSNIFTIFLLFVQGIMINVIVIEHRLSREINLFPGLFYILLASSIPDFLQLSPFLLANTFYILSLSALFSVYKKSEVASHILNAGIWIGIASLFYFSYISLIFLAFIGLTILRAFKIKERLMFLSGVFVPFFLFGIYFFWTDRLGLYLQQFYFRLNWGELLTTFEDFDYLKLVFFLLLILVAFLSYGQYTFKQNIQAQKNINILNAALAAFLLSLAFSEYSGVLNLLFLTVPLGILISFNFSYLKKSSAGTIHFILLVSILLFQYKSWFMGS